MQISAKGKANIVGLEGIVLSPYLDSVNVKTVGIGATGSDIANLASWPWDKTITVPDAIMMFNDHILKYDYACDCAITVPILQHQYDAIVSICYNIGIKGMQGSTFIQKINEGASINTVALAIMMWTRPAILKDRRTKEKNLFLNGIYSENGKAEISPVDSKTHKAMEGRGKGQIIDVLAYF